MSKKNRIKLRRMPIVQTSPLNIIERQKAVNQLADDVYQKITREDITNAQRAEFVSEATDICVAVFARILMFDYGKLKTKETRLAQMYKIFIEYYQSIGDELANDKIERNAFQREAEEKFKQQVGYEILGRYRK